MSPAGNIVECYGVSLRDGRLLGRRVEAGQDGDPDEVAARSIGLSDSAADGVALLHSTSWRWDPAGGSLVLTYLCCPDPCPEAGGELTLSTHDDAVSSNNPSRPRPEAVSHAAALNHGLGHLAWLAANYPDTTRASQAAAPAVWGAITRMAEEVAGRI